MSSGGELSLLRVGHPGQSMAPTVGRGRLSVCGHQSSYPSFMISSVSGFGRPSVPNDGHGHPTPGAGAATLMT